MTIQEIHKKYTQSDLQHYPGDAALRYKLFAPILQNLPENKIIYRERFIVLATIENLIITPDSFEAKVIPYLTVYDGEENYKYRIPASWSFSAGWGSICLIGTKLSAYSSWSIWCEPEQVKSIEQLVLNNQTKEAVNILYETKEI